MTYAFDADGYPITQEEPPATVGARRAALRGPTMTAPYQPDGHTQHDRPWTVEEQARNDALPSPPDLWEKGALGKSIWNRTRSLYETWLADPDTGDLELGLDGKPIRAAWEDQPEPVILPPPGQPMAVAAGMVSQRLSTNDGAHRVRHWRGAFWEWRTSHWLEMAEPSLRAQAYRFTEHAQFLKPDPKGGDPQIERWAPNRYKIADLIDALRAITHLSETVEMPAWLTVRDGPRSSPTHTRMRADEFVSCANGLLHVPTRTLYPHDPSYFNRVSVPFDYQAEPTTPRRWHAFLDELWPDDPDARHALAEFFGYIISGRLDLHKTCS